VSKSPSYKSIDEIITGHHSNDIQIVSNNALVADFDVYNESLQNLEDGLDFEVTFTSPNLSNLETDFASSENFKPFQNMELNGDQETNDHAVNLMASSFPFITEVKNAHLSIIFASNNMDFLDELPPHITQKKQKFNHFVTPQNASFTSRKATIYCRGLLQRSREYIKGRKTYRSDRL
jgi:hypothetical protein